MKNLLMKNLLMKKSLVTLLAVVFAVICFIESCSQKLSDNGIGVIDIEAGIDNRGEVNLSKYASGINYIPLDGRPDFLMGDANNYLIRKFDDRLFFFDHYSKEPVLSFSTDGTPIATIGTNGRASNEFRYIVNFVVNENSKELIILDMDAALIYDSLGNHKVTADVFHCSVPAQFGAAGYGNDGYLFMNHKQTPHLKDLNSSSDQLLFVNSKGEKYRKINLGSHKMIKTAVYNPFTGKEGTGISRKTNGMYASNNEIYVKTTADTIYIVDKITGGLNKHLYMNFGKYGWRDDFAGCNLKGSETYQESVDFAFFTLMFNRISFPQLDVNYTVSNFVYDKKSGETTQIEFNPQFKSAAFTNDIDGGPNFLPTYIKDGYMYQLVNAIDFIDQAELTASPEAKEVALHLTEESNPVLIAVKLK